MPRNTTVVTSACWYLEIPQSQCNAGPSTLSIVISIESLIQQRPTQRDNLTWNQPNPSAFTAWVTVKVSRKRKDNLLSINLFSNRNNSSPHHPELRWLRTFRIPSMAACAHLDPVSVVWLVHLIPTSLRSPCPLFGSPFWVSCLYSSAFKQPRT